MFGDSECPGGKDDSMVLWIRYSCDGGNSDGTKTHIPSCNNKGINGTKEKDKIRSGSKNSTGNGTAATSVTVMISYKKRHRKHTITARIT